MKKTLYVLALVFALAACTSKNTEENTTETVVEATPATLFDRQWNLAELNGDAVVLDTSFNAIPHLKFTEADSSVVGNAGCNGIGGAFTLSENNGITFTKMRATLMACPNLEVEQQFLAILENVKKYRIEGGRLSLDNENNESLAKLEGVEKP